MLYKDDLEIIGNLSPGFYSHLLVEKDSRGRRLVVDLFPLDKFIQQTPFKMETASSALKSVRKDNFMALADLPSVDPQGVLEILLVCLSGHCLSVQGPRFGLSSAPRPSPVFTAMISWDLPSQIF